MVLKIYDINNEVIEHYFNSNIFTFYFSWIDNIPSNYILTFTNKEEIDLNQKIDIFNLFEKIKNCQIKIVTVQKDDLFEKNAVLFDSEAYELTYNKIDYVSEYGNVGLTNIAADVD
jgi:hypothetical protein